MSRDPVSSPSPGSMMQQAAEFPRMSVLAGANILVSGGTHTDTTTMLKAPMSSARRADRVVTVEETFELDLDVRDLVAMQCRQPSLEGSGRHILQRACSSNSYGVGPSPPSALDAEVSAT